MAAAEADPSTVLVVCPDDLTRWHFERTGFTCSLINDDAFHVPEAREEIVELSTRSARGWYRDEDGADFTAYRGLSLGGVLEGHAWWLTFGEIFKFAGVARRLVKARAPGRVLAERALSPERRAVLEAVCGEAGVPLAWVGPQAAACRRSLARYDLAWPLDDQDRKRRVIGKVLSSLPKAPGRRILASYYHTLEPMFSALGRDRRVDPLFYAWPGRRLLGLPRWTRWGLLAAPSSACSEQGDPRALDTISRAFRRLCGSPAYQARFALLGLPCWEAVRLRLEDVVKDDFPFLARQADRLRAALDACSPDAVVIPYDSSPPERMLILEARSRGIPSAIVMHAVAGVPLVPFIDTQADHLFVGGAEHGDLYAREGVDPGRIHATGLPLRDLYAGTKRTCRPKGSAPRILLFSASLPIEENIGRVLDLLRRFGSMPVTVRPRPGESVETYRRLLSGRLGKSARLEGRAPLRELLAGADLVLGGASTAILEAAVLGIPVILLNLEGLRYPAPFTAAHGFETCASLQELERSLDRLLPDNVPDHADYGPVLDGFLGKGDGLASRRIVDALLDIVRERSKEASNVP